MMGSMGEMMGGTPRKQLYPQLMEVPVLTAEARRRVESEAHNRINAGNALLAEAQKEFHSAMIAGDSAAMSRAATRQREAVTQMESGAAVLQALAEGKPPQQIALTWFRDQLSLTPQQAPAEAAQAVGPFGLTWFHFITMATILSFIVAMLGLNVAQRRRARALINRLTSVPSVPAGKLAVPPATAAAPPAPILPAAALSQPEVSEPPAQSIQAPRPMSWSGKLRVAAIHRETPHVKTFRLVNPSGERIPFTYSPGQFLTFSAEIDGRVVRRSYSMSSPPTRVAYVEITVKREENGTFSAYLHDKIVTGDLLSANGPGGVFTFDGAGADSIVLIAGGVGITPLMCVLRYLLDLAWRGDVHLLFAAGTTEEFVFREELEYLQKRHHNLHVVAAMASRAEGTAWMGLEGRLTKNAIAQAVPQIERRRVHLCGPPPMMAAIRAALAELGVPKAQIRTEAFGPAIGAAPPPPPSPPQAPPAIVPAALRTLEPALPAAGDVAVGPATALVKFVHSEKTVPLPPDKTVLEVAESVGVPIDYSCRVGTCGTCKTRLLEGTVSMEVQDALTAEDKAGGWILACQAKSLGNVAVDA